MAKHSVAAAVVVVVVVVVVAVVAVAFVVVVDFAWVLLRISVFSMLYSQ